MKDRNHVLDINLSHQVNVIENGLLDIPMLQILQANGEPHAEATVPDISQQQADRILSTMQFVRILDERMVAAQRQGRISFYFIN